LKPFKYLEPSTVKEACALLSKYGENAKILAGGQSIILLLRQGLIAPEYIINIKNLHELEYIRNSYSGISIGALTTHSTIKKSSLIKERFPVLIDAEKRLAHTQIRNWGTVGGNLCHADPATDLAPPLIGLGAKVKAASIRGEREIALRDFFVDMFTTALKSDEILTEIEIPYLPPHSGCAYRKETIIAGDYPLASAAAIVTLDSKHEIIKEARIVLGGLGATPIYAEEAAKALTGKKTNAKLVEEAGAVASRQVNPVGDVLGSAEYKQKLAGLLTNEMVKLAIERARKITGGSSK
jgi:carbon-monoxide dehydrogenase medium subunit